jgi:hypothetical protein
LAFSKLATGHTSEISSVSTKVLLLKRREYISSLHLYEQLPLNKLMMSLVLEFIARYIDKVINVSKHN